MLDTPEICSRFNENLAIVADNELNSLMVCSITRLSLKGGSKTFSNITLGNPGITRYIGFK